MRSGIYWRRELLAVGFVVEPRLLELGGRLALGHLRRSVPDPELRAKLTPHYTMGCKRILPSNDFYQALTRPNVELVTGRIAEVRPRGIVTRDGRERALDAIVYATGFEAAEAHPPFRIVGRRGQELGAAWNDGVEAYLGTTVCGFPNLFFLVGPNTGLGHTSMTLMMESQFACVVDALRTVQARNLKLVDVRPEAQRRYNARLQARLAKSVWNAGGCVSWYRTRSGKNTTLWPGFTFEYRLRTRRFDPDAHELVPDGT